MDTFSIFKESEAMHDSIRRLELKLQRVFDKMVHMMNELKPENLEDLVRGIRFINICNNTES